MATIAPYVFLQEFDNDGSPLNGGLVYTYEAGTTTPKVTYTDQTEETANTNPVVLDSNGRAKIWLGTGNYKLRLRDATDSITIAEDDNVAGQSTGGVVSYAISTNTSITELYDRANIYVTGTTTLSLLPVSDAGDGFTFWVFNDGVATVTIDPDASETINGSATLTLGAGETARVSCDGTQWYAFSLIADASITTAKIADDAVTTDKISDANVTTAKIANDAVTADKLANTAVSAGSYTSANVTVDAQGRITAASNGGTFPDPDFTSPAQTPAAGTDYTIAHGLGVRPKLARTVYRCKTAEFGYAVGTEVEAVPFFLDDTSGTGRREKGTWTSVDDTNIYLVSGSNGAMIAWAFGAGGEFEDLTNANWDIITYLWI